MNTNENKKMTEEDITSMGAVILTEVIEQFRKAAENAEKMANTFKDVMMKLPFGLVIGISLGEECVFMQVLGSNTHCEISMDGLRKAMEEDKGTEIKKE